MPVVQHGTDLFETTECLRFLAHCQQRAVEENQAKIASFPIVTGPVPPAEALSRLAQKHQRHFYYDPPGLPSRVGVSVAIDYSASGAARFARAQDFIDFWQNQFLYADPILAAPVPGDAIQATNSPLPAASWELPKGQFFCSATFFDQPAEGSEVTAPICPLLFAPVYVFVPEVGVTTWAEASVITVNCLVSGDSDLAGLTARIQAHLQRLMAPVVTPPALSESLGSPRVLKDVSHFEAAVAAALHQVHKGRLHKVVLADVLDVVMPQPIDGVRSLKKLRQNHPDCTVFSVSNGKGQCFIGASPERLLSIRAGQLMTEALAGSAPRGTSRAIDRQLAQTLLSSQKERYEHRVVVDFIVEQLRSLGLEPCFSPVPRLLPLLHIQHLHTPIQAALFAKPLAPSLAQPSSQSSFQPLAQPLEILARLHPTPAVAGLPREAACEFIRQHESFERGLYTAPLGWIDGAGNSEFIVGIRSALIDGAQARLYAGAGIVAGSTPARELAEIKLKLQTLLNALA